MTDHRLDAWRTLADPAAGPLLAAAAEVEAAGVTPSAVTRLRRDHPDGPIPEALELAGARRRGGAKFEDSTRLLLDRGGVEQATSGTVASWKATRFGSEPVLDLCCGIGGDAMALARRGPCLGVDRDPVRAFMASYNAGIETVVDDVEAVSIDRPLVHLDPARRDESSGRRSWRLEDLVPGVDAIRRIVADAEGAAIKLGPGLPMPPPVLHDRQSVSVVAESGRLVQAIVWTGRLARSASVEAVDLPSGRTIEGEPAVLRSGAIELEGALLEFHPAVERVGLGSHVLHEHLGLEGVDVEPAAGLGLAVVDLARVEQAVADGRDDWFRAISIDAVVAPRPETVADAIRTSMPTPKQVVVRTRGGAVDADDWTRRLAVLAGPAGTGIVEVHGLRLGRRTVAVIGRPIGQSES